jgi:C4-dicarboxylate transporter, DctM subunit
MDTLTISIIAIVVFFILICFKVPIAFAFAMVGAAGTMLLKGLNPGLNLLGSAPYQWATNGSLLALPLFILMGQFIFNSGISSELYEVGYKWVGNRRGGLAIATELASTAFGACCGASIAAAATMGTVAYPEMKKYKYDDGLACGAIAAGGSLSTLIPPSAPFIVYGFLTSTSVSALFIAGILPGLLLAALYIGIIVFMCWRNPSLGPRGPQFTWLQKLVSLKGVVGALILFVLIMGGLFAGIFTASEAGAIGAFGAFILMILKRKLNKQNLWASLKPSITTTCFILTITIGAMIFTNFLTIAGFSRMFANWITGLPFSPTVIMICILFIYLPLGCVMDSLAMVLLTIPIVFPIISAFGYNPVWFGVVIGILSEAGLLTPPVGMNSFVVHGVTKVPLHVVFRGIAPFFVMMIVCVAVLFIFPDIATFLPGIMK